ncbi:MAG TPA: hypothetical protein DCM27_04045 [Rhodospirillaceae bacterium]|nr:hypothetical protein [Rhodospirillaceae bacterium]
MDFTLQEYLGGIASIIGLWGSVIYIHSTLKGKTTPHLYTWLVFSILTWIAFAAQLSDNAGPGAWVMGITAFFCTFIALLSLKYGEQNITKSDRLALAASLSAILPWLMMEDPLVSVIMISMIDAVAMYPTIRKSWHKPHNEKLTSFNIGSLKNTISLFALTNVTLVTTLYSVSIIAVNCIFVCICLYRRRVLAKADFIAS